MASKESRDGHAGGVDRRTHPNQWCNVPVHFGKRHDVVWAGLPAQRTPLDRHSFEAARLQHRIANLAYRRNAGRTLRGLASELPYSYDVLARIMRGDTYATVAQLLALLEAVAPDVRLDLRSDQAPAVPPRR